MRKYLVVAVSIIFSVGAFSAQAQAQTRLAFGATNSGSAHYAYFAAISKVVNQAYPDMHASVVETGATVDNLRRMARGQLDLGLVTTSTLYNAYYGKGNFKGRPIKSKLLWVYNMAPQNAIVRKDSGISSIKGLAGKRFGPGQRQSSTEATSIAVMKALGVKPKWVRGTNGELANMIKDDRINGFIKSAVGTHFDALTTDIATFTPVKVLGVNQEQASKIKTQLPGLSIISMPGGKMEHSGPYKTWGFLIGVSAAPGMSDKTAYRIVKAILKDKTEQAAAFPQVKGKDLAAMTLKYATTPLDAGAIRAFEEAGYDVPARLK